MLRSCKEPRGFTEGSASLSPTGDAFIFVFHLKGIKLHLIYYFVDHINLDVECVHIEILLKQ